MDSDIWIQSERIISDRIKKIYDEINEIKAELDVVILSHYYMPPELQLTTAAGGVADFVGDSLGLSIEGKNTKAKNIVFCGVHFMAETAKILDPSKHVYIPDKKAGCSLASSITPENIRELKRRYPGVPVMAYVNTTAATKAECDICCTSRNAVDIASRFDCKSIIFIPDKYMGQNLQHKINTLTGKHLILWDGSCEVHEQFSKSSLHLLKDQYPDAEVLLHWEVPEETVSASLDQRHGVVGSTNDILKYVGKSDADTFILASECDLGATLKGLYPDKEFVTPCIKCQYMKMITLEKTYRLFLAMKEGRADEWEVTIPEDILTRARIPIERMLQAS